MFIYLALITLLSALVQGRHGELPQPEKLSSMNIFEEELLSFIEKHILNLDKYKKEIENILAEILEDKNNKEPDYSLTALQNSLALAHANGDHCAGRILTKFNKDDPPKPCPTVDDLVKTAGQIITDTTDIITGTIHSFYLIFADETTCSDLSGFRCFLAKFHQSEETVFHVVDTLKNYSAQATKLVAVYKDYFNRCRKANVMKQIQYYSACHNLYKAAHSQN